MSGRRIWVALAAGWALLALAGCRFDGTTRRVEGYLFTVYNMPRRPHPGKVRIGLRVQDRDYRILTRLDARLIWSGPGTGAPQTVSMEPGPGRDFRAQIQVPQPGGYRLEVLVATPEGEDLAADYQLTIPAY